MNEALGVVAVVGVISLLLMVMIGFSKLLDELAENKPKIYQWVTGTCTIGIFVSFVIDAFFVSIGVWGIAVILLFAPLWAHAFWLRDGEDFPLSEQEGSEEIKDGA